VKGPTANTGLEVACTFQAGVFVIYSIDHGRTLMSMDSLKDLYVDELKDLYSAENQILKALPQMAKKASAQELKDAFNEHLEVTRKQVERLDEIFTKLGVSPKGKKCKAMEGLIEEGKEVLQEKGEPSVIDAALIAAAQRVEHYEMAGYGCVRTYAKLLEFSDAEKLLQETLDEEAEADEKLTELADSVINPEAEQMGEDEEESIDSSEKRSATKKSGSRK
jgi:ferritin-like metal-binding protein YciE